MSWMPRWKIQKWAVRHTWRSKRTDALEAQRLQKYTNYGKSIQNYYLPATNGGQNPKTSWRAFKRVAGCTIPQKNFGTTLTFRIHDCFVLHVWHKNWNDFKELTVQHQDSILVSAHQLMAKIMDKPEYYKVVANYVVLTYEPGKCPIMDAEKILLTWWGNTLPERGLLVWYTCKQTPSKAGQQKWHRVYWDWRGQM